MLATWADQVGIPRDRLLLVNLRGRRNPLDHLDDRAHLVDLLRAGGVEVLLVDPFGRAYNGKSQNDAGEVTGWLCELDRFATDVGASELVLTVHAGWYAERTRGSSALEDWADVVATIVRDQEDDTARYLSAFGRDVEVDEDRIDYDPDTRMLTLAGTGSRKHDQAERVVEAAMETVRRYVADHPGCSGKAIRDGLGMRAGVVDQARQRLVDRGDIVEEPRKGRGGGKGYRIPDPDLLAEPGPTSSKVVPDEVRNELNLVPSLYRDEVPSDHLPTEPRPTETEATP